MSLTESMRKDPDKYSCLLYHNNTSSNADYTTSIMLLLPMDNSQQNQSQDYIDVLIEEAEKLYNKLIKELVDESISGYGCSISSPSLPLLPPSDDEKEQQPRTLLQSPPEGE